MAIMLHHSAGFYLQRYISKVPFLVLWNKSVYSRYMTFNIYNLYRITKRLSFLTTIL